MSISLPSGHYHLPVMVEEVLAVLDPAPGKLIVDGTLGGGGHTKAILERGAKIIGLDQDATAIGYCIQHLVVYDGDTVRLVQTNFRHLRRVLTDLKIDRVDGLLLDIGTSSAQLDQAERGFSFQQAGPLDMRMDREAGQSAADLINGASAEELERIFRVYGEEPAARRIAGAIVRARVDAPILDTIALGQVVEQVVPRHGPRHPATRVFQALRIAVNDELAALEEALEAAVDCLRPGGRMVVITFHSLEDRIVKKFCRETTTEFLDRPEWPAPRPNPRHFFRPVVKRSAAPSPEEVRSNPRARSARLRALERL